MALANVVFRGMPLTAVYSASFTDRFREGAILGFWMAGAAYLMLLVVALPIHRRYRDRGIRSLSRFAKLGAILGMAVPFVWSVLVFNTAFRQPSPVTAIWGLMFFVLVGGVSGSLTATVFWTIVIGKRQKAKGKSKKAKGKGQQPICLFLPSAFFPFAFL
jgi:hypothetical protein